MLTKVRSLGETVQGQLSTVACGGARAELGDGDDGVLLRASFPYGTMRCRAVKVVQGSGGPEMRRRRVIARNELTCGGAPGGKIDDAGGCSRG